MSSSSNNAVSFPYTHPADEEWLRNAVSVGFDCTSISRDACIEIREKTGAKLPRWLMKDPSRRIARGLYACPELHLFAENARNANK